MTRRLSCRAYPAYQLNRRPRGPYTCGRSAGPPGNELNVCTVPPDAWPPSATILKSGRLSDRSRNMFVRVISCTVPGTLVVPVQVPPAQGPACDTVAEMSAEF